MKWNTFLGRWLQGTFLLIWTFFFFGDIFFKYLGFRLSKNDADIPLGALFFLFACYVIFQGVVYLTSREKKEFGAGDLFKGIFFAFWCIVVLFFVVPSTIGKVSVFKLFESQGFWMLILALGIGIVYALLIEIIMDSWNNKKGKLKEPLSYDKERKESSSILRKNDDDRFKR